MEETHLTLQCPVVDSCNSPQRPVMVSCEKHTGIQALTRFELDLPSSGTFHSVALDP
jgi:hypothetical protein